MSVSLDGPVLAAPAPAQAATEPPSQRHGRVRVRRIPSAGPAVAVLTLALFVVAAVAPAVLATDSPTAIDLAQPLRPPSSAHWFGTDESGRDLWSRVVHGTRDSLVIGLGAAAVAITAALVLGTLGALSGRAVRAGVHWLVEVLFAFPTLLLALLLVAILGPSAVTQVVAVGVGSAPGYARIVRGQVLAVTGSGYVEAARGLGHQPYRILARHILPNALRPLVAIFALAVGQSIVWASSLSFLGLGVAPPSSEWGALLDSGRLFITRAPWLTIIPGAVIVALALAVTALGCAVRDRLERGDA